CTSRTTILLQPKPGGTRSLNCLVALSTPKITTGVSSGVTNLAGKSSSTLHQPYPMSKVSLNAVNVNLLLRERYKVCATPLKTSFRPFLVSQFPRLLSTLKLPPKSTITISLPWVSCSQVSPLNMSLASKLRYSHLADLVVILWYIPVLDIGFICKCELCSILFYLISLCNLLFP